ncbi:MAG: sigma-70 family RNA polymerase sigma factor [Desulfobacterales bacterium]|nr:sigma-70 family RNA polymerase sigma factor [Desulfobacterales bacterium]
MTDCTQTKNNNDLETAVQNYLVTGSKEAVESVVRSGETLINYYAGFYGSGRVDDDLKQAGYEGILKALKRYDPARNVMFSTFATHCIIGEIRHELRNRGPFKMPDWLKSLQAAVIRATEELAQKNGVMPTLQEIAKRVNVAEDGIVEAMHAGCVSIDDIDFSKVKKMHYESFKLPIEDKITVQMSLERMDDLSKKVITYLFYEDLTQEQTAKRLGISQRKVSRIMIRGLDQMRAYLV